MPRHSEQTYPRPGYLVEVAPDCHRYLPAPPEKIPAIGVFRWKRLNVRLEDGTPIKAYIPVTEVHDAWIRIADAERLPIALSSETIQKLIRGNFVEGGRSAPNAASVNLSSLLDHIEATRADFDFWKRDNRRARFDLGVDEDFQFVTLRAEVVEVDVDNGTIGIRAIKSGKLHRGIPATDFRIGDLVNITVSHAELERAPKLPARPDASYGG